MKGCRVCHSPNYHFHLNLYDDRYGYPGSFDLMRCDDCGHAFLRDNFTSEQLTELYSNYYPRSTFDLDQYRPYKESDGFRAWLNGDACSAFRWVPRNVRVLDIGCGFGQSLGYHASRGCDVYGVETDKNIRRVAEKFGYKVHVGLFDPDIYEADFFDYVTMDQVIEHVTDPLKTLQGVARILKPGGKAVLTTPNAQGLDARFFGKKWINWHTPYHLQFFSKKSMQLAAEQAGLRLESVRTITSSEWLYYQWIHLATCPQSGSPSVFWAGWACGKHPEAGMGVRVWKRMLALMHKGKINHLLTRLFDAMGVGDSYLFMLSKS